MPSHPNVLFVVTDQHRADHVGFAGNDVVRTPRLDALAARGTVFDNAWVADPSCMPNRATLITGRHPTAHGVVGLDRSLDWGANTIVRTFRAAGYRTGLLGKSHFQHGLSRMAGRPTTRRPAFDDPWPQGWDHLEHAERFLDATPEWPDDFYGFDHVRLAIDHGARVTGHHYRWAIERGADPRHLDVRQDATSPARRRSEHWWQVYEPPYDAEFHSTNYVTEMTIEFIEEATSQGRPFFCWSSFPDPHHPFAVPAPWFDRHDPADMTLPRTATDPLLDAPAHIRAIRDRSPAEQPHWVAACGVGDGQAYREALAVTYGSIEFVDDGVGRILAALDRVGQLENTIIVFTSDHGDMMGDHGLMLKGFMHYRGLLQVPLVIVDPSRPGGRSDRLAGSIDVAPTLLDLAGLEPFEGIQGTSLVPILDDPQTPVRDALLVEEHYPAGDPDRADQPSRARTIVTADGCKYTRFSTGDEQLFDLSNDPDELDDLSSRDARLRLRALECLTDAMIEAADGARGAPVADDAS